MHDQAQPVFRSLWFLPVLVMAALLGGAFPAPTSAQGLADILSPFQEPEPNDETEVEEFLETDRNAFTLSRLTPGTNRLVVESSFSFIDAKGPATRYSYPELLLRYGWGPRIELRLGWNYEQVQGEPFEEDAGDAPLASFFGANAEAQVYYGAKYQVTRQKGLRPDSAFLAQGHTPTGGPTTASQVRLAAIWGWTLPNKWNLDSAVRFGTDGEEGDHYTLWAPSIVLKIPLGREERWFTHLEYFGIMSADKESDFSKHFVDTGLHYFITPDWEIGAVIAFPLNEQSDNIFVNVGTGFRF